MYKRQIDGEMYVDGGTFNNFPADIMRNLDLNKVIGIDFMLDKNHKLTIDEMPTNNQILRSKLMSSADKKYRLPSIGSIIINSTLMYSNAKRHESIAYLDPVSYTHLPVHLSAMGRNWPIG